MFDIHYGIILKSYRGMYKHVQIPERIKLISEFAFENNTFLNTVEFPKSLEKIGGYAFSGCKNLEAVYLHSGISVIEQGAFSECQKLEAVRLPDSIVSIGETAFFNCVSLTSIRLPNQLRVIERDTFCNCSALTSVKIPNTVTRIGEGAFHGCTRLKEISLPENVEFEETSFPSWTKLEFRKNQSVPEKLPVTKEQQYSVPAVPSPPKQETVVITVKEADILKGIDITNISTIVSRYPAGTKIILKLEPPKSKIRKTIYTFSPLTKSEIQKLSR